MGCMVLLKHREQKVVNSIFSVFLHAELLNATILHESKHTLYNI